MSWVARAGTVAVVVGNCALGDSKGPRHPVWITDAAGMHRV